MGVYNTYGDKNRAQIKVGENLNFSHFSIGDQADIPDGLYITYDGIVIVRFGRVYDEFTPDELFDKWGKPIDLPHLLYDLNPVSEAIEKAKHK